MIDDAEPEHDPALLRRWGAIRSKLAEHSESVMTQGVLVSKITASGRRAWTVRWVERSGVGTVHRTIYIGDDERLIGLVRRQLEHYRMVGDMPGEIAAFARIGATASFAVRRLAGGRQRRGCSRA